MYNWHTPIPVYGNKTWLQLSAGGTHTCGIDTTRDLYCFGANGYGEEDKSGGERDIS
jgi:hypothetical protein